MKKTIIIITVAILLTCAFFAGRTTGIRHAIEDSAIWTVNRYDPEDPDASAWNGYDQLIYIEIDGNIYEHGMYQC